MDWVDYRITQYLYGQLRPRSADGPPIDLPEVPWTEGALLAGGILLVAWLFVYLRRARPLRAIPQPLPSQAPVPASDGPSTWADYLRLRDTHPREAARWLWRHLRQELARTGRGTFLPEQTPGEFIDTLPQGLVPRVQPLRRHLVQLAYGPTPPEPDALRAMEPQVQALVGGGAP